MKKSEETKDKTMIWETEILDGVLTIKDKAGNYVFGNRFTIPAGDAVGPEAKKNILTAATGRWLEFRCVTHTTTWHINTRTEAREIFRFRRPDIPDIEYKIELSDAPRPDIRFDASESSQEEFSACLREVKEKRYDEVSFRFCSTAGRWIREVGQGTDLRYLSLLWCASDCDYPIFQEIGRLIGLRGLLLHDGAAGFELNAEAVGELGKLKLLESLAIVGDFPVTADGLSKLGTLKNLKALNLSLGANCGIESREKRVALSFLRELEILEFLTLSVSPRLSPGELELPPNLKYLEINRTVCRLHVRPAKSKPAPEKTKPDDGGPSLF